MAEPIPDLFTILSQYNPWWTDSPLPELPAQERLAVRDVLAWAQDRQNRRALLIAGARQIGKTTLLRQCVARLLKSGIPPKKILYATLDHPRLKLAGLDRLVEAWNEFAPPEQGERRYLFLDEVQNAEGWEVWLKHRVDFSPTDRVAATGSAAPLREQTKESGVGRWETLELTSFTFREFLRLREVETPELPEIEKPADLFALTQSDLMALGIAAEKLVAPFHELLVRGGFPEPALAEEIARCQRLVREDVVDRVLKRDLTTHYGFRRVEEAERLLLYLCASDGQQVSTTSLAGSMEGASRTTISAILDLFEATYLIHRLKPHGYGKTILRAADKIYLADPAIPGAMDLLGWKLLEKPTRLGIAAEGAVFRHLLSSFRRHNMLISFWRDRSAKEEEVDFVLSGGGETLPIEVKYQDSETSFGQLKGLLAMMRKESLQQAIVVTRRPRDIGYMKTEEQFRILRIPAPLFCYWMSQ